MTHAELVTRAVRWLRGTRKCRVVYAEMTTRASSIPDAIGFGRQSVLVEVKVSRSDYAADAHKLSARTGRTMGDERWYLTPPGLLQPHEVREGWGLIEAHSRCIRVIVQAPRHPSTDASRLREERDLLVSACRRHQLGVEWRDESARFRPMSEGEAR